METEERHKRPRRLLFMAASAVFALFLVAFLLTTIYSHSTAQVASLTPTISSKTTAIRSSVKVVKLSGILPSLVAFGFRIKAVVWMAVFVGFVVSVVLFAVLFVTLYRPPFANSTTVIPNGPTVISDPEIVSSEDDDKSLLGYSSIVLLVIAGILFLSAVVIAYRGFRPVRNCIHPVRIIDEYDDPYCANVYMLPFMYTNWVKEKLIGRGVHSRAYLCHQRADPTECTFVMKEFEDREVFQREAMVFDLLADKPHHHIINQPVYIGDQMIIMEYCSHGTLSDFYQRNLSEADVALIVKSVLLAIDHLSRSCGLMHNDVKPGNIGISDDDSVKLFDFSSSSLESDGREGGQVGTIKYMAPEVLDGCTAYDSRADVFSLGMTVVDLLSRNRLVDSQFDTVSSWTEMMKSIKSINTRSFPFEQYLVYNQTDLIIDFLNQALIMDQTSRPRASELLEHPLLRLAGEGDLLLARQSFSFSRRF